MSRRPGPRYPSSSCSWERCGAGVFADGSFTGVVAAGLTLLAVGGRAWAGGLLLGFNLYPYYGLVLAGPLALAVVSSDRPQVA